MRNEIVVDLDDTLSFTLNRDFKNARPNTELIQKLNGLFDKGYKIHIVTARGQISCNGDSQKASDKYYSQIATWLNVHKVKYTTLSFEKKLARYYIDDKAITPEQFLELNFENNGKSGCHIVMDNQYVYKEFKTFEEAQALIDWSNRAGEFFSDKNFSHSGKIIVPKIHTLIGTEIKMDRIRDRPHVLESLKRAISIPFMLSNYKPDFNQTPMLYFMNIFEHLKHIGSEPYEIEFMNLIQKEVLADSSMLEMVSVLSRNKSFSHGDYTIQNVLNFSDSSLALIDPIYSKNKFSSWYLDLAKFKWSLVIERNPTWLDYFNREARGLGLEFNKFVICEGIRTLKYCTPSERLFRMEMIEEICEQE